VGSCAKNCMGWPPCNAKREVSSAKAAVGLPDQCARCCAKALDLNAASGRHGSASGRAAVTHSTVIRMSPEPLLM
jgi:hypothetical protein